MEKTDRRPDIGTDTARQLAEDMYGKTVLGISELKSHSDRNFYIRVKPTDKNTKSVHKAASSTLLESSSQEAQHTSDVKGTGKNGEYVLKVTTCPYYKADEKIKEEALNIQAKVLNHLLAQGFVCLQFQPNVNRELFAVVEIPSKTRPHEAETHQKKAGKQRCLVFMYNYIQGQPLYDSQPLAGNVLYDMGRLLADLRSTFEDIAVDATSMKPVSNWSLETFPDITQYLDSIQDHSKIQVVEDIVQRYNTRVKPVWLELPTGLIHGDFHDENLLHLTPEVLQPADKAKDYTKKSIATIDTNPRLSYGLIDFMDMAHSASVCDLAVALAFAMIGVEDNCSSADPDDFILSGGHLLAGYVLRYPLNQSEMRALFTLVQSAYCMELVIGQYEYDNQEETNDYLLTTSKDGWRQLTRLMELGEEETQKRWTDIVSEYKSCLE